jgi:ABC-2 type transport system permease protein
MMTLFADSLAIAKRDIIRSFRQRSQLYGSIVRPLIWLFLLGNGLRGALTQLPGGFTYSQYIFPGMLVMNVLFSSIQSGTSIIWDREFGFLKEIMVAPVSRVSIALGKTLAGSVVSVIQGIIALAFFPFLGLELSVLQIVLAIAALFLFALAMCSVGVAIAARMKSFEGFGTINNFFIMPLFFLSGALYPTASIPQWLKVMVVANPVSYAVNLQRSIILGLETHALLAIGVLAGFTAAILGIAVFLFSLEGK